MGSIFLILVLQSLLGIADLHVDAALCLDENTDTNVVDMPCTNDGSAVIIWRNPDGQDVSRNTVLQPAAPVGSSVSCDPPDIPNQFHPTICNISFPIIGNNGTWGCVGGETSKVPVQFKSEADIYNTTGAGQTDFPIRLNVPEVFSCTSTCGFPYVTFDWLLDSVILAENIITNIRNCGDGRMDITSEYIFTSSETGWASKELKCVSHQQCFDNQPEVAFTINLITDGAVTDCATGCIVGATLAALFLSIITIAIIYCCIPKGKTKVDPTDAVKTEETGNGIKL